MKIHVLYVEDDKGDSDMIKEASCVSTEEGVCPIISVEVIDHPHSLKRSLHHGIDLVLSDVCFPPDDQPMLDSVLRIVKEWCDEHRDGAMIPVIAYTSYDKAALAYCIEMGNQFDGLYDIWDKSTACPEYVIWRIAGLALEFASKNPDRGMLRFLSELSRTQKIRPVAKL